MVSRYELYQFTYIDRSSKCKFSVFARTIETANEIVKIENTNNTTFNWVPKKIGFIKKVISKIPPYELESIQLECAENRLKHRVDYYNRKEETD